MTDLILTFEQALDAFENGSTTGWAELTARLPRNDLPAVLAEVAWCFDTDQLAAAVTEAWVMCEFPEQAVDREQWLEWFARTGYIVNGNLAERPESVTLYRGGISADRMAWTSNRQVAEWFRDRWPDGRLWTVEASGDALLAHCNNVRLDESGQSEDEYVIDPTGLRPKEVR